MIRRFFLHRYFSRIGKMGGQARARKLRRPIIETARRLRLECGLPPHPALERAES